MINRPLYEVLKSHFGTVRVTNENVRRLEEDKNGKTIVISRGEHYNVDCPLCGDTKGRLSVSYLWLEKMPMSNTRRVELAHCFNENCDVHDEEFWRPILEDVELARLGVFTKHIVASHTADARAVTVKARLPEGFTRLDKLPEQHPAVQFAKSKYKIDPVYLGEKYSVGFTDLLDIAYPQAQHRLIFPIYANKELVAWQGRTILPEDSRMRWFLPPGFMKVVYNADSVLPTAIPIIGEGIPAAIACGTDGVAIFGKTLTEAQLDRIASTWSTAIIATDPDTFVPDYRPGGMGKIAAEDLKKRLDSRLKTPARMIKWPLEILELARRYNHGEKVNVPDPADLGIDGMKAVLRRSGCL